MDFEEAWREAMQEDGNRPNESSHQAQNTTIHDKDPYDEFSDDDLMQSVPFANDTVPVMQIAPVLAPVGLPSAPEALANAPQTRTLLKASADSSMPAPRAAVMPARRRARAAPSRGVLDFPPTKAASFMLRGDDGRVRWVTAASSAKADSPCASPKQHNRSRKRTRTEPAVIEVGDDDDVATGVVEVDSSSSSMSGGCNDDDDLPVLDSDDASSEVAAHPSSGPPSFLRDGVNVKEMLRKIYEEDAKKQGQARDEEERRQRAGSDEHTRRESDEDSLPEKSSPFDPFLTPSRPPAARAPPLKDTRDLRKTSHTSGELWVTKYSPKLFREVLSDETINLQLLQWLKSWDPYVFPEATAGSAGAAGVVGLGKGPSSVLKGAPALPRDNLTALASASSAPAAASPPEERIAVLTGPPGVGKTTLVHVLAAHCGYEVIEVNASVERTASRLEALIKTAVSAAGPAPGGRVRRPSTTATGSHADDHDDPSSSGAGATTSLVQHLLRPKCLVIDEMDGIASSSVATYLMQLQLHRPVFCLCNDFYVPSLRPLRQRCSHVYYLPPIRPQRLLARLEEIARREHITSLDQMALSTLIATSGGDVRSCLNTMQFINSVVSQQQQQHRASALSGNGSGHGAALLPSQRHTVNELIRRMQGKDTRLALKESWQLLFNRPERNKAVQLLKQDCGVDYEGIVEAAAAQHARGHIVEERRRQERERAIGHPSFTSSGKVGDEADAFPGTQSAGRPQKQPQAVAFGFRVDPGYMYAAQQLLRCPDTAGLVDGLQENYLDRAYTDYSFTRTSATAESFSQQDVVVAASFQQPAMMMGAAERLNVVSALTCYVHCSTAARGGRIEFPREQATLRRLHAESRHIGQQFRSGCRPQLCAFLGGEEITGTDVAPMLLRCLFDRALRLPAHAMTSFSRLPPADQRLLQGSVARHVEYGLTYEKDRQYTPSFGGAGRFGSFLSSNAESEVPWRLSPELDKLLAGVVRPMEKAMHGGYGGGGGRGSSFFQRSRHGERNGSYTSGGSTSSSAHKGFASPSGAAATNAASSRPSLSSVLMPLKNEVRQILVGEIRQYRILQSVEFLKKQAEQHNASAISSAAAKSLKEDDGALALTGKRPREEEGGCDVAPAAAATAAASVSTSIASIATEGNVKKDAMAVVTKAEGEGAVAEVKRVKLEDAKEGKPAARTAVRRDFFGRPITDTVPAGNRPGRSSNATTPASASPSPTGAGGSGSGQFPRSQPPHVPSTQACVRYVYQDGSTNAVKMPAVLADF